MLTTETVSRLFSGFDHINALIIGDVMVDAYLWGSVDRISPEAPVPIVSVETRENRMGGAANVGLNVSALGANAILCSVIGNDQKGNEFLELLKEGNMSVDGIIQSDDRITTTKFRVIGNNTQMLRVDEEQTSDLNKADHRQLENRIRQLLENSKIDVVIFQDYDKGVITPALIDSVISMAKTKKIPVAVDPKKKNFLHYKNATLFKPNLKEIKEGLNIQLDEISFKNIEEVVNELANILGAEIILNTLSEHGVFIKYNNSRMLLPAHVRHIADVSGAGDTVISVAALCLAMGIEPTEMAAIANLAGGLVCEEVGVVPVNKTKLMDEVIRLLTK